MRRLLLVLFTGHLAWACGSSAEITRSASIETRSEPEVAQTEPSSPRRTCVGRGPFTQAPPPTGATRRLGSGRLRTGDRAVDLAFVSDCALAVATSFELRVWDLAQAQERWAIDRGPYGGGLGVSPDGASIVSGDQDAVVRYDARTGAVQWRREVRWGGVKDAAFSNDGRYVVVGGRSQLRHRPSLIVLDASDGSVVHQLARGMDIVRLAVTRDGTVLAGGELGRVARLDVESGVLSEFADPLDGASSRPGLAGLVALPDGGALIGLGRNTFQIDPAGEIERIAAHADSIAVLADGRWVRAANSMVIEPGARPFAPEPQVHHLATSPDERWLAGFVYPEQRIGIWSLPEGERWRPPVDGHESAVRAIRWRAGHIVSTDGETVIDWALGPEPVPHRHPLPEDFGFFAMADDGQQLAGSSGIADLEGELVQSWSRERMSLGVGDWRDGWVARLGQGSLHMWAEGSPWERHVIDTDERWQVLALGERAVYACAAGGVVARFALDAEQPRRRTELAERTDACRTLALAPDGRTLVVGHARGVGVVDTVDGRVIHTLVPPGGDSWPRPLTTAIAVSRERIAVAWSWLRQSHPQTTVYRRTDGVVQCMLGRPDASHRQRGPVRALAFSPDGQDLATGGEDGTTVTWNLVDCGS